MQNEIEITNDDGMFKMTFRDSGRSYPASRDTVATLGEENVPSENEIVVVRGEYDSDAKSFVDCQILRGPEEQEEKKSAEEQFEEMGLFD